jgi:hypothetical protein
MPFASHGIAFKVSFMTSRRHKWVAAKTDTALALARGHCGGSYGDAILVLCGSLSAMAAECWPGPNIDRQRFCELLVRHFDEEAVFTRVSIPLYLEALLRQDRFAESDSIARLPNAVATSLVVSGSDVDKPEHVVRTLVPGETLASLRHWSYASILYREVRSSYVHEYSAGTYASELPMTRKANESISYVNSIDNAERTQRAIHFHVDWLAHVAVTIATRLDDFLGLKSLQQPAMWWVNGNGDTLPPSSG